MARKKKVEEETLDLSDKQRKEKAEADIKEIEARVKKGEFVAVLDLEREWSKVVLAVKGKIAAIPNSVARELATLSDPAAIEALLKQRINDALGELSRGGK